MLKQESIKKYVIPIIFILLAMVFAIHYRMYPANLPVTDEWATNTIHSNIKSEISNQVSKENPNLPDTYKEKIINERFDTFIKENKDQLKPQIEQLSSQFKQQYQTDDGDTYLLAIDPYLWYRYGLNYLECGESGCYEKPDGTLGTLRDGRNYQSDPMSGEAYLGVFIYKVMNIFGEHSLMKAFYFIPIIFIILSIIPAFFIAKKVGGNVAGLVAGLIIGLNTSLLSRTMGGFADNDGAIIMFPLLIMWFLIEFIDSDTMLKKTIFATCGALSFYLMTFIWRTEHVFAVIVCSVIMYLGLLGLIELYKTRQFKETLKITLKRSLQPFIYVIVCFLTLSLLFDKLYIMKLIELYKTRQFKETLKITLKSLQPFIYVIVCFLTLSLLFDKLYIMNIINNILSFVRFHDVATTSAWPNVLVTVAELNVQTYSTLITSLGGMLWVVFAVVGLILTFIKKKNLMLASVLFVWTIASVFSYSRGIRFNILVVPTFAIYVGICLGLFYKECTVWVYEHINLNYNLSKVIFSVIIIFILILPVSQGNNMFSAAKGVGTGYIPSYNYAWDDTLNRIKFDADDGYGYITTWWDFGHWFVAKGIRVTFDGGNQGRRIHWVGKSLITNDEHLSVSILRMLNCGQEKSFTLLENYFDNDTLKAVTLTYETIVEDKDTARAILMDKNIPVGIIDEYLLYTHCDDLFPHYFITSEDMVGKAPVWGHFGSWNFTKATMWQSVKGLNQNDGVNILINRFGLKDNEATGVYYEIQRTSADRWVSPWPAYQTGKLPCTESEDLIKCQNVEIDKYNATTYLYTQQGKELVKSLSFINQDNEFVVLEFDDYTIGYSVLLLPDTNIIIVDPAHADSMFTRLFYYEGIGLEHYEPFYQTRQVTGQHIKTWKINYQGGN
jgi:dolichyl-phosphooligosaccharide-protein glycotransferase